MPARAAAGCGLSGGHKGRPYDGERLQTHCVGAGLVPARAAAGCGPPGGHKGRPYEGERLADRSI